MEEGPFTNGFSMHFPGAALKSDSEGGKFGKSSVILGSNGEVYRTAVIPKTGDYILRVNAFRPHQAGKESVRMEVRIDNRPIKTVIVTATKDQPQIYEMPVKLAAGERRLAVAFLNSYFNPNDPDPDNRARNLVVRYIEIAGLMEANEQPESYRLIFVKKPTPQTTNEAARAIISNFATRAFRRPVTKDELERRLTGIFQMVRKDGGNFNTSLKAPAAASGAEMSPQFFVPRGVAGRNRTIRIRRMPVR